MPPSENEIFREATLRICGNLNFEYALQDCLNYLRTFMPADCFHLNLLDKELGLLKLIAIVTAEKAKRVNLVISLDDRGRKIIDSHKYMPSLILDPFEFIPIKKTVVKKTGLWEDHSALLMQLFIRDEHLGNLTLFAKGTNRYSEEHLRILSMLREPFSIALSNALRYDEVIRLKDILTDDLKALQRRLLQSTDNIIIGADMGLKRVIEMAREVAPLDSPVLLHGETGVGKEVIANSIHRMSRRSKGPFIQVNCGAIPETLIDSELFGHEKGAFTGAISRKRGCFERADGGTIFLDEVAELPLPAQVRMLRVLQEKEIIRVGGDSQIKVDIRIIAATHQNLEEMVRKGSFRADLRFRLNVFPVFIPPLRDRREDIPALVNHFIEKKSRELQIPGPHKLERGSMDILKAYPWPGNVRELENVIERALILNRGGLIRFEDVVWSGAKGIMEHEAIQPNEFQKLDDVNSRHIRQALKMTNGRVHGPGGAAELLGLNPSTLRHRMKKLGIKAGKKSF
ncbi:MAG: sigma 54-interacting transcriptional regulator [Deltaproteobacteria bacterium]|nr:sigma 54-interacting transcriptional regulator [Deltaproteobacteria bacterium]